MSNVWTQSSTYIGRLADSISMVCLLYLNETAKGGDAKLIFAAPPCVYTVALLERKSTQPLAQEI